MIDGDPTAVVGEQELGGAPGARMAQRPARGAVGADAVDQRHGLLVKRHHPLGRELAQRHLQPGALAGDLVHTVELEVDQLTHAQPGGAGQQQRVSGQPVAAALQRGVMLTGAIVGVFADGPPLRRALRQLVIGLGAAACTCLLGLLFGATLG